MCRKKHQIRNRFAIASILSGILDSVWQAHALKILARALRYDLGARRLINARAELCRRVVSLMRWFRICSLTWEIHIHFYMLNQQKNART